jgi:hypothetical protein
LAAGLVEAAVQARAENRPVLLVAYDLPPPAPLAAVVPCALRAGFAMLLAPTLGAASLAAIELELVREGAETTLADPRSSGPDGERRGARPADPRGACRRPPRAGDARMAAGPVARRVRGAARRGVNAAGQR